jgi:hypothetical protein
MQGKARIFSAPASNQNLPDCLQREPIRVLQPASTTPGWRWFLPFSDDQRKRVRKGLQSISFWATVSLEGGLAQALRRAPASDKPATLSATTNDPAEIDFYSGLGAGLCETLG